MSNEFNFIHESLPESDKNLFFGPLTENDSFVTFDDSWTIAHFLVHVGVFPSLTQARKNSGDIVLSSGWNEIKRGKNQNLKKLFILNKF